MSAMSASPVKPVLPSTGVNVPPPVATSPPKVGLIQIPPSLTIEPTKPPNINHTVPTMPLSLIADHKVSQQFSSQPQTGGPPPMQQIPQSIPRTPEKPKDLVVGPTAAVPTKPTSNGMEGLPAPNPIQLIAPALPESVATAVPAPVQKQEPQPSNEVVECNTVPGKVDNVAEATAAPVAPVPPPVELDTVKKEESVNVKTCEPTPVESTPSATETQEPVKPQTTAAAPTAVAVSSPSSTPVPANSTPPLAPSPTAPVAVAAPSAKQPTPTQEPTTSIAPSVSRTDASLPVSKPELKVATIPRQATKRKREPKATYKNSLTLSPAHAVQ